MLILKGERYHYSPFGIIKEHIMKLSIRKYAKRTLDAVKQPEVRHSLQYRCGLFRSPDERTPLACFRIQNECHVPLIRLIAILALLMLIGTLVMRTVCRIKACCRRPSRHDCDC